MPTRLELMNRLLSIQEQVATVANRTEDRRETDIMYHVGQAFDDIHVLAKAVVDICFTIRQLEIGDGS